MTDTDLVHVVLASPADPTSIIERVEAVDKRVHAIPCRYVNTTELRTMREQDPFSSVVRTAAPQLTDEQRAAFAVADVILSLDVPPDLREVAPRVKWVQNIGSGVGQYVSARLPDDGITLTNVAGVGAGTIAEFIMARVLEHRKRLRELHEIYRAREWRSMAGGSLAGRTMTVVGLGAIGAETARRARAFDMHVVGIRRSWEPGAADDRVDELYGPQHLHEVLARSDVVALTATGGSRNTGMFDTAAFAAMAPGSFFVNVTRGSLVDEPALIEALRSGHLGGAAIDVAVEEPLPPDNELWDAPNLAISAHCSLASEGYFDQVVELFCDNLTRFLAGQPLKNLVDLSNGY